MTSPDAPAAGGQDAGGGGTGGKLGFLTRKLGPLPLWVWMVVSAGGLYLYFRIRAGKTAASSSTPDTSQPADTTPPVIFQDYVTLTPPSIPPAGGRATPPTGGSSSPPAGGSSGSGTSGGGTVQPAPPGGPKPQPVPTPHPAATTVTVARFTSSNPPWNSTLSGIASHEGYGSDWGAIWNNPANAALKARRKQPNLIQPGDKVIVPAK